VEFLEKITRTSAALSSFGGYSPERQELKDVAVICGHHILITERPVDRGTIVRMTTSYRPEGAQTSFWFHIEPGDGPGSPPF